MILSQTLGPSTVADINSNGADFERFVPHYINSFFLHNTDADEIIKVRRLLKPKFLSGYDHLPTKTVCGIIDLIFHPLAYLFNLSFSNGIFPSYFKISKIVPLYKGGDTSKLINVRSISIFPSLSKVLERIMYNKMVLFIDSQPILHFYQFGFRSHVGLQDAIATFVNFVANKLDKHENVSAIFLDVAKAFDSIDHDVLLNKLYCYDFRSVAHQWFASYIKNRMQYVNADGVKSRLRLLRTGMAQWSVLGPLMFLMYINDLPIISPDNIFILFADDVTCLTAPARLQHVCNCIGDCFSSNKLALGVTKTKQFFFFNQSVSPELYLNNSVIECVNNFKFLGCYIDNVLSWRLHIEFVCKKVANEIAMLRASYRIFPMYVKKLVYYVYIYPFLTYSLVAWGNAANVHVNRIITLQKQAIKLVYGIKRLDNVAPIAHKNSILLLPELYEMSLSCFIFHCYVMHYNASLFISQNIIPHSGLSATSTHNSQYNLYLPYVRTSLCKSSIVYKSI